MPQKSYRHRALEKLVRKYERAKAFFIVDQLLDSDDEDSLDLDCPSFLHYLNTKARLDLGRTNRYFLDRVIRKSESRVFEDDLRVNEDGTHWLNDREFKHKYRMSRDMLDPVTKEIEGHDIFKKGKRGARQRPVKHQLMILLQFLGKEGESNNSQRQVFKIGSGACQKCRERVVEALCSLREIFIRWPDDEERKLIAKRIEEEFFFPNCAGNRSFVRW